MSETILSNVSLHLKYFKNQDHVLLVRQWMHGLSVIAGILVKLYGEFSS